MTEPRTERTCSHGHPYWGCAECLKVFHRPHEDRAGCFCRPTKTYTDPVTQTEVWVHRYADD